MHLIQILLIDFLLLLLLILLIHPLMFLALHKFLFITVHRVFNAMLLTICSIYLKTLVLNVLINQDLTHKQINVISSTMTT
jgi:hypothetical protein